MNRKTICYISILICFTLLYEFNSVKAENVDGRINIHKINLKENRESKLESAVFKKVKNLKPENKIRLIIESNQFNSSLKTYLINKGAIIEANYSNLIQALISPDVVEELSKRENIRHIREPLYPLLHESEGVEVINADDLHDISVTGVGVKVAILDVGFRGYTIKLGNELPSYVTVKSFRASGGIEAVDLPEDSAKHGTACAEIIHDVAPDALLYLVNCGTDVEFVNAVNWLISKDVDIISISIGWINAGPYDGTGMICDAVNYAGQNGVLVAVSSGNYAQKHYEGQYNDFDEDYWNDFSAGDEVIRVSAQAGDIIRFYLSWSAPWPTHEDYDIFLFDSYMNVVNYSTTDQATFELNPVEALVYDVPSSGYYYLGIQEYSTSQNWYLEVFCPSHELDNYRVSSSSITTPADATGAFTVGATYWLNSQLESFSSQGPTNDDRVKPDICAPDGVTNSIYTVFFGSSASAPHVAGAAALILQSNGLSPESLRSLLEENAIDHGDYGKDNLYGSGILDIFKAFSDLHATIDYISVRGNNNLIYYTIRDEYWRGWLSLPGKTQDSPASIIFDDAYHLVVRGLYGGLYHGWVDLSTNVFSGWSKIDGDTSSAPVLTVSSDKMYLIVRGLNDCIYYRTWDGSWDIWQLLPGKTNDSPGATVYRGELNILVKGMNGVLYHGKVDLLNDIFLGWNKISGSSPCAPFLVDNEQSIILLVRGNNDEIYYREYTESWSAWMKLPGKTSLTPGASMVNNYVKISVKGSPVSLYFGVLDTESYTFSGWTRLTGDTPSPPRLTTQAQNQWRVLHRDDFETVPIDELPEKWIQTLGTSLDTVSVNDDQFFSPSQSLKLHENGYDGESSAVVFNNLYTENDLLLDFRLMISGEYGDRTLISLLNEKGQECISLRCMQGVYWAAGIPDSWVNLEKIPTPMKDVWYHVQILVDSENQKARYIVDDYDSGWLFTIKSWKTLKNIQLRTHDDHPMDSWFDNIIIIEH